MSLLPTRLPRLTKRWRPKQLSERHAREDEKKRDYLALAEAEGLDFIPFVMESFGGFGKEAKSLIEALTDEALLNGVESLGGMGVRSFFTRALSVCLQGGNGQVMQDGCALARKASNDRALW